MKRAILSLAIAAALVLSGCSDGSGIYTSDNLSALQESYDSVVAQNSSYASENTSLENENSSLKAENEEYRMPKDHVKRITKVLAMPEESRSNHSKLGVEVDQYNLKSTVSTDIYEQNGVMQVKCICNIKTDNSLQEKAAFCFYFFRVHMNDSVEGTIDKGCENVVTVINDNKGSPIAVWLAYKSDGEIKHDMCFVNVDVLKALDEVLEDTETWKPHEDQKTYPIDDTSGSKQSDVTENHKDNLEYDNFIKSPDVEQFVVDKSRHIWYCSGGAIFASYLEENNFSELTDDELVVMMYYDMVYGTKEYLSYMPIYTFYISDKNGDYVALGFVTVTSSENGNDVSFALTWFGEYERLNTNAKQIEIFGD